VAQEVTEKFTHKAALGPLSTSEQQRHTYVALLLILLQADPKISK
jgi:hypothetical protein